MASRVFRKATSKTGALVLLAVAILIGRALALRAPDRMAGPGMAAHPVILPGGAAFYRGEADGQVLSDRCPAMFVGREHVAAMSFLVRDPARGGCAVRSAPAHLGMRLVSDRKV